MNVDFKPDMWMYMNLESISGSTNAQAPYSVIVKHGTMQNQYSSILGIGCYDSYSGYNLIKSYSYNSYQSWLYCTAPPLNGYGGSLYFGIYSYAAGDVYTETYSPVAPSVRRGYINSVLTDLQMTAIR